MRQRQHVLAPLAQRRELDRDHVQAEEEILAEAAGRRPRRAARGWSPRRRARRPRRGCVPPTRSTSPSCSTRSSFAWKSRLISPISSRKSVPPCGALEAAGARRCGAGEGALLVAEQLALEHALGERLAVDGDERPADAVAPVVQQARHQLLAGAALALDQHRRPARRDAAHQVEQLPAARALGDHRVGRVAARDLLRAGSGSRARGASSSSARPTSARSSSLSNGLVT